MNHQDSSEDSSSLDRLSGFAPIDEPSDNPSHDRWWRWALACSLGLGLAGLGFGTWRYSWLEAGSWSTTLALIGLLIGARLGYRADRAAEEERVRSDCERKDMEDLIFAQRLAETRKRMRDDPDSR